MPEPVIETHSLRRFQHGTLLALLAVLLGAGALGVWKALPLGRKPVRILLVAAEPDPEAGISHHQARALALLAQDALETSPAHAVTVATAMPGRLQDLKRPEPWLLLNLQPRRQQGKLGLRCQWVWSSGLANGPPKWEQAEFSQGTPTDVMRQALLALPLDLRPSDLTALLPAAEGSFWGLLQANTLRLQNADREEATRAARAVTVKEPQAAEGWFILGSLLYRGLLDAPESSDPDRIREAESCFEKGLALAPEHPRGIFQLAQMETNEGEHREALEMLLRALRKSPRNPLLLTGLVYSARNAGLLALAKEAADRRDRWAFSEVQPLAIDVLFLYMGDFPRFEATLKDQPGHLRNSIQRFFRGYLALVRKDNAQAIEAFRSAEAVPRGYPHYLRLARAFRLGAEGSSKEAQETLRTLELDRVGLKVPDGEFTLRMAEGYALAGEMDHAMELAERAFAQGFGAAAWFEASPFLDPLRQSPRWRALIRHVRERQALLESRFPAQRLPGD